MDQFLSLAAMEKDLKLLPKYVFKVQNVKAEKKETIKKV